MKRNLFLLSLILSLAVNPFAWADITVSDLKTVQASGGDYSVLNENATISADGTLKFIECSVGQSQPITITMAGGVLEFKITGGSDSPHTTPFLLSNKNGGTNNNLTLTGTGTIVKSGAGYLASSPGANATVTYSLDENSLIDIQSGTFIYGGQVANMNANMADLKIAKGASINLWDTTNSLRCDVLSGEGRIYTNTIYDPAPVVVGAANGSGTFAGTLVKNPSQPGTINASQGTYYDNRIDFIKVGTGTQTMTGANTYAGYTRIDSGTLAFADGTLSDGVATSGKIGSGAVEIKSAGTLEFNSSADNTIVGVLSGTGTLKQLKAGSTLTLQNGANTFSGKLIIEAGTVNANSVGSSAGVNIANGAAFELNSEASQLLSIANKGTFVKSGSGALGLTMTNDSNGTTVLNGGSVESYGNRYGLAIHATADSQINLSGPEPWQMTLYTGYTKDANAMKAEILPGYSGSTALNSVFVGTRWNMNDTANTNNARGVLTTNYSMLSMKTTIFVDSPITVDLANGRYDDWAAVFLYSIDDQGVMSETPTTLLGFGSQCSKVINSGVAIQPGGYVLEVRLADFGGGVGYYADSNEPNLNIYDSVNNIIGVGIRKNGDTALTGNTFMRMDIDPATGLLAFSDGSLSTWNPKVEIKADIEIDEGNILTVNNSNADIKSVAFTKPITGKGTLLLNNDASGSQLPVSILSTEGSIDAGNGIRLSVEGDIDGNLSLQPGSVMDINPDVTSDGSVLPQAIGGDVTIAAGAKIYVDLTDVTSDAVLNSVAGTLTIDPDAQIIFTTSNSQLSAIELTVFGMEEALSGLTAEKIAEMISLPDNLRLGGASTDKGLTVTLGDSNSVPEPSTWLLLALGLSVLAGWKRAKDR